MLVKSAVLHPVSSQHRDRIGLPHRIAQPSRLATNALATQWTHARVWAVSDLHADYPANFEWAHALGQSRGYHNDILVVAGDISEDLTVLRQVLLRLTGAFAAVFFTPGNHEAWLRDGKDHGGATDSVQKLVRILELCDELGVHYTPRKLGALHIVPLFSWHHKAFDREPDLPGSIPVIPLTCKDYASCKWSPEVCPHHGSEDLATWFDALNDEDTLAALKQAHTSPSAPVAAAPSAPAETSCERPNVISFAHFLPHQALHPEKRFMNFSNSVKVMGSCPLARRIATLKPDVHIFGHSHLPWDATLRDGVRYIQAPLCYPGEQSHRRVDRSRDASWRPVVEAPTSSVDWLPLLVYRPPSHVPTEANSAPAPTPVRHQQSPIARGARVLMTQDGTPHPARHGSQWCPTMPAYWSAYYALNDRQPDIVHAAPWVRKRRRRSGG